MNHYLIEMPTNAATVFAGRVLDSGGEEQMKRECSRLTANNHSAVEKRQNAANSIAGKGVAATEISAVQYTIIPCSEWDSEFRRRSNRRV